MGIELAFTVKQKVDRGRMHKKNLQRVKPLTFFLNFSSSGYTATSACCISTFASRTLTGKKMASANYLTTEMRLIGWIGDIM